MSLLSANRRAGIDHEGLSPLSAKGLPSLVEIEGRLFEALSHFDASARRARAPRKDPRWPFLMGPK